MQQLSDAMPNINDDEDISSRLQEICSSFPFQMAHICRIVVRWNKDIVVNSLRTKGKPEETCIKLYYCSSSSTNVLELLTASSPMKNECAECQDFVNSVKPGLTESLNEKELEEILETGCYANFSPAECDEFVDVYKSKLIELLMKPWDAETTCQMRFPCEPLDKTWNFLCLACKRVEIHENMLNTPCALNS
nr:PREDICTED: pulmonary surfactant-associated protein B-like [Latimeria chalumnae]|eukprot:XP_014352227.1 PREDICTED: pulmonary surfactant-associated protein B-like [Latimeria chalumnae]